MATETLQVRTRDGKTAPVQAEVRRFSDSARLLRGGGIALGGTILGVCTIVIPVLHLISTWLVPIISLFVGFFVYSIAVRVDRASGKCPGCSKEMSLSPGAIADDTWLRCNHCALPMQIDVSMPE